jgi:hypothetical protein
MALLATGTGTTEDRNQTDDAKAKCRCREEIPANIVIIPSADEN